MQHPHIVTLGLAIEVERKRRLLTQTQLAELKKKSDELNQQVAQEEGKRKTYTPGIEARLLSQYEKILKSREGLALVPVVNNACGGCHLGLPPQTINEILQHEKLIVCESCARILYWPE